MFGEQQRFMLLLIAPAALLLTLFQVVPIAIGANASFRDWALYNPKKIWVGFAHYQAVITDPAFLYVVLPNTFPDLERRRRTCCRACAGAAA
jgi:multiple sugar transport system permease protein